MTRIQSRPLKLPPEALVVDVLTTVGVTVVAVVAVGVGTPIENGLDVLSSGVVVVAAPAQAGAARLSRAAAMTSARRN